MRRVANRTAWLLALGMAIGLAGARPARGEVTPQQLQLKIDSLVADIRATQRADGSFVDPAQKAYAVGQTALAVMALRAAGVPAKDPAVARAAAYLHQKGSLDRHGVYQHSLRILALRSVDPQAYMKDITASAGYLMSAQQPSGGWSYKKSGSTDNSNSQFALLGLHAAALSGVTVPEAVWRSARDYFVRGQRRDGGWAYKPGGGPSYGSMTAAGVASLFLCDLWLHVERGKCGEYYDDSRMRRGLSWLAANFAVAGNPYHKSSMWKFYYLYALERAGVILARKHFGQHDWYREGAEHLIGLSGRAAQAGSAGEWPLLRRCFSLLFLAKGNAPVLLHKASWTGVWNEHRYDARFLVQYVGGLLDQPLDWQILPLNSPLDDLMGAPILYVSGRSALTWTDAEVARLKEYMAAGGFVLVEAVLGDETFDRTFRSLLKRRFPEEQLSHVPQDHPIYTSYFQIPQGKRPRLEAVAGPCWISLLYAPDGLSCAWDVADFEHGNFKMGANIVAYATGFRKLEGKLTKPHYRLPAAQPPEQRRGAFTLGQVVHSGDWQPHKTAWAKVLDEVNQQAGLTVYSRPVPIRLDVESPFGAQMLYLTGVKGLELNAGARRALRLYLERGGFLFAEAACGSAAFDKAFRRLMKEMYPDRELRALPLGHPLFEGGGPLDLVNYSPAVRETSPGLRRPVLEFIELDGRAAIVYSKYDISSAIDGHPCYQCPSVLEPSASRLAIKIVLYGLAS